LIIGGETGRSLFKLWVSKIWQEDFRNNWCI
jgi:hypothetical protein